MKLIKIESISDVLVCGGGGAPRSVVGRINRSTGVSRTTSGTSRQRQGRLRSSIAGRRGGRPRTRA